MSFSPTLKINLNNIGHNFSYLKKHSSAKKCGAVVKANAYGLGIEDITKTLINKNCEDFFVTTTEEAEKLSKITQKNIYVFNGLSKNDLEFYFAKKIIPVLNDLTQIEIWREFCGKKQQNLKTIINIDTGMNRLGINSEDYKKIEIDNLNVSHLMTHFACADQKSNPKNLEQIRLIEEIKSTFPNKALSLANSHAIFNLGLKDDCLARPGIAIYGGVEDKNIKPVVELTAPIIQIREIKKDGSVGYGGVGKVKKGDRVAVIPIGYEDGYLRSLGNKSYCYINGKKAKILGKISMDLIVININKIPEAQIGEEVEVIGKNITINDLAKIAGTKSYEILTSLGNRLKREYIN